VRHEYTLSLIATERMAVHRGIEVNPYILTGPVLPRVRNAAVANALADKCDWIVFVDDDIGWSANDFFKLMQHDLDVVAAAPANRHQRWDDQPGVSLKFPPDNRITGKMTNAGRVWQVLGLGTAFLAIKADVFSKMDSVTQPYTYDDDPHRHPMRTWFWLDLIPGRGEMMEDEGEDYNFCRKWREIGGHCWVDPDIRLRHYDGNVCHDRCLADMETTKAEAA
jgi:glycosyltransferase involved in cell wall biosynthesis